jgi:plastocyanin
VSREARDRVLLGVGIPLGAFVFLAAMILAFSRILLAVPEELAPWVALLFATNILVACALAATIRGTRGFVLVIAIVVLTIVGGGVAGAVLGERPVESLIEGEQAAPESPPPAPPAAPGQSPGAPPPGGQPGGGGGGGGGQMPAAPVQLTAQGIAFSTSALSLPAGGDDVVAFTNNDPGTPHNFAIYTQEGGEAVFQGDIITGPASTEYRFPAPDAGTYHFQCDVHPTVMFGTATVG